MAARALVLASLPGCGAGFDASTDVAGAERRLAEYERQFQQDLGCVTSPARRLHSSEVLPSWTWPPNNQCKAATSECLSSEFFKDCKCSQQVHLTPAGPGAMVVQWTSSDERAVPRVAFSRSSSMSGACFVEGNATSYDAPVGATDHWNRFLGDAMPDDADVEMDMRIRGHNPVWWSSSTFEALFGGKKDGSGRDGYRHNRRRRGCIGCTLYNSPSLLTVKLTDLASNTRYYYQVDGDDRIHAFVTPPGRSEASTREGRLPAALAGEKPQLTLGLMADIGQTIASNLSVTALLGAAPDLVLHAGDLSYADGVPVRWDSFGRMMEPLSSEFPTLHVPGNHEVFFGQLEAFNKRYQLPYRESGVDVSDGTVCGDSIGGSSECHKNYWSFDVGPAHIIGLNVYDCSASPDASIQDAADRVWQDYEQCAQYKWLRSDLEAVSTRRAETPWLIVMFHTPFYSSNAHYAVTEDYTQSSVNWLSMKDVLEPLFYEHHVDLVVNGHLHAYERTHPVFDWMVDSCGPAHLTLGDAGNYERIEGTWKDPQPHWSAFRENSFGVAGLYIMNATHAYYEWNRHSCVNRSNTALTGYDDPNFGFQLTLSSPLCTVTPEGSWSGNGEVSDTPAEIDSTGHDQTWMVRLQSREDCKARKLDVVRPDKLRRADRSSERIFSSIAVMVALSSALAFCGCMLLSSQSAVDRFRRVRLRLPTAVGQPGDGSLRERLSDQEMSPLW